ncbi:MAG: DUF2706 domain-containing protein [Janthinobacterium lividum]|uniref:DUF2706 domain-containing protein n=2 Tax=Rickettsia bellii TaxID=33990 RepID=A0A0F3QJA5_RICBE|nr:DUF2706 domain-containing protein [Rickettsia bellii]MCC8370424.1 DUF2706 domain-containing protein [Rickettsia endosymbiont of Stiretrus anchorago]MCC8377246.1 DUF2706 domain-containing protein [Rickettsia endosymbiont of Graphium doson]HJD61031.1 DUF2706 domain-containing protein [Rickettsia endosymbiont of Columbicola hoogstraali]HJD62606.1 DUF2706 domain-containing protein [Rickettsia endosymbiont of Degeeriella rufa]ARD86472.1 hypothetical protein A3306_04670 [Rickettsia bellii]
MLKLFKFGVLLIMLSQLLSCTPSAPYEIKSPCVAAEINDEAELNMNPCVRRPVNSIIDIA